MQKSCLVVYHLLRSPWVRWGMFLVWFGILLYAALKPTPPAEVFEHSDKYGHVFVFVVLAVLGKLAIYRIADYVLWPLLFTFAIALEYVQDAWRPLRKFSLADAYSNLPGVAIGMVVVLLGSILLRTAINNRLIPDSNADN